MIDSSELVEIVDNMLVYEEQRFGLVGYIKTKKGLHKKVSDHMALVTILNCKWNRKKRWFLKKFSTLKMSNVKIFSSTY